MKVSTIANFFVFTNNKQNYFIGYEIITEDNGTRTSAYVGNTRVLQEDYLKSLNRGGWVFKQFVTNPDKQSQFPVFQNAEREVKLTATSLNDLAKANPAKCRAIQQELLKQYKFDASVLPKYGTINPELRKDTTPAPTQQAPKSIQQQTTAQPNPAQQPASKPAAQVTQQPAQTQQVAVADKPNRPKLEVNWVESLNLPIVKNLSPEFEKPLSKIKQGIYTRFDRSDILKDLGVKRIETESEYHQFLIDYANGKIDTENDARGWLNLNFFVNPDLLHTDLNKYHEDKLLSKYLEKKHNSFTTTNIKKLNEFFVKYPSPFLSPLYLPGYKDLLVSLAQGTDDSETFQACLQYFVEEPIEGFNHVYEASKIILEPKINIPSLKDPTNESHKLISIKYIPKVGGKADFSKVNGKYTILKEYENYVSIKMERIKPLFKMYAGMNNSLTVTINHRGDYSLTSTKSTGGTQKEEKRISNYFLIRTKSESSVTLPYPTKDGKFRGMSEEDYTVYSRIYNKIQEISNLPLGETEYTVLDRIGYSADEIEEYLKKECGKTGYLEIKKEINEQIRASADSDEVDFGTHLKDVTDEHVLEHPRVEVAFGSQKPVSVYQQKLLLAMKHRVVMSVTASNFYRVDLSRMQPSMISNLADMAINYGYATPQEVYNELERILTTGEPASFKTPVKLEWKTEAVSYNNFLANLEKEKRAERLESSDVTPKVVAIITNFRETKEIGLIGMYSTPKGNVVFIDTFLRMKKIVRDSGLMFENGYVMEDRFVPFNPNEKIERMTILDAINKVKAKELDFKGLYRDLGYSYYVEKIYKPQISKESASGKPAEEIVEPPTIYELVFSTRQRTIKSEDNPSALTEQQADQPETKSPTPEPEVKAQAPEAKPEPKQESVSPVSQISDDIDSQDSASVPVSAPTETASSEQEEDVSVEVTVDSPAPQYTIDTLMTELSNHQDYLSQLFSVASGGHISPAHLVGLTKTQLIYHVKVNRENQLNIKMVDDAKKAPQLLKRLGIYPILGGNFITMMSNGKYIILDESLQQI